MDIVFDLGGTNIRLAASSGQKLRAPVFLRAPRTYARLLALIKKQAVQCAGTERIRGVAGGIAGPLDTKKTRLVQSTHLPHLARKPFKRDLERIFHARVVLENDAVLFGLGESHFGAGKGYPIVASVIIGTGIGGVRIVNGKVDANAFGFEPGHHILDACISRHRHQSPHPGDWESLVSGSGLRVRYGMPSEHIRTKAVWNDMAKLVAIGLVNVTMFWSPNVIVLGGSFSTRLPLAVLKSEFQKKLKIFPKGPRIIRGKLGDFAGLYGGLVLLRMKH